MKTNETPKMKADETAFSATFVILLLIILPSLPLGKYGGGIAMLVAAVVGPAAYVLLFRQRLRARGQLKSFTTLAAAGFVIGVAIAAALVLLR